MGSFSGHVIPGSLILFLGLWNLRCSVISFLTSPRAFVARVWHPVPLPGHWARLQLYAVVGGGFAYMVSEFVHLFMLSRVQLNSYEHLSTNVAFVVAYSVLLVHASTKLLPFPRGTPQVIVAFPFTCAAVMFLFHSTAHHGPIEARYHLFIVPIAAATVLSLLLSAAFPTSFLLDILANVGVFLQGAWYWVTAAALYGYMQPPHCRTSPTEPDYKLVCEGDKWDHLGISLVYVHFAFLFSATVVALVGCYALAAQSAPSSSIDFILDSDAVPDGSSPCGLFAGAAAAASAVVHPWTSKGFAAEGAEVDKSGGEAIAMAAAILDVEGEEEASLLGGKDHQVKASV
ncbi:hypothetical protein CLOM_g16676 [Closterium sp. NIES-68]|nr:hypothetical protein CLOM_g16676 [Closterium sp. NIES-68]GJP82793.1 hypothetical protein CLOP_g13025 [Closterium sp. NIES-67]